MNSSAHRARTAALWVGVIVPLVILALSTIIIAIWLPQLPDPVATHWGMNGVDGFGPRWMQLILPAIGAALVLMMAGATHLGQRGSQPVQSSPTSRLLAATSLGLGSMMAFLAVITTDQQRGLKDATDAPDIGGWVAVGFGVLIVLAVAGWFLQPKSTFAPAPSARVTPAVLLDHSRTAWLGTAKISRGGGVVLGLAVVVLIVTAAVMFALDAPMWWLPAGLAVLIILLVTSTFVFRIRVDASGLLVRSTLGWPRTHIPASDIAEVTVVHVVPFAEFGGWGWRIGLDGRTGVVLRTGDALQVKRRDGRIFIVTVDDAKEAASVLAAMAHPN